MLVFRPETWWSDYLGGDQALESTTDIVLAVLVSLCMCGAQH